MDREFENLRSLRAAEQARHGFPPARPRWSAATEQSGPTRADRVTGPQRPVPVRLRSPLPSAAAVRPAGTTESRATTTSATGLPARIRRGST